MPNRTLALELCPQYIGRAPQLHCARRCAARDPHDLQLRSYTGTLPHNRLREHSYVPFVARRSSHAASYPDAAIANAIAATADN